MSDIALNTSSNLINNANNAVDGVEKKDKYDEIAGQVVDELWDKCTSQDTFEELSTEKKPSKLGRIIARIAGGILLGAGLAAAAAATVVSLGVAPAIIAAAATAIGGIAGTSIAAGVTGAAGIACLAGSFVGGRSAEAFVEGQHSKHSTNDNLAMITNGKVTGTAQNKVQAETFSGLRRSFNVDDKFARYAEFDIVRNNFDTSQILSQGKLNAFDNVGLDDITFAIDVTDPKHPKLVPYDHEFALKPEYISNYVKNVIEKCKGKSTDFSSENVALIRFALNHCFDNSIIMGTQANRIPAFHNESFINEISSFTQNEMNKLKNSENEEDIEKYNLLSIFKAALKLSEEDIAKLAELDKQKPAKNDDE